MVSTFALAALAVVLYLLNPNLDVRVMRKVIRITFFLQLFYLIGHYLFQWPFPVPLVIMQILATVALGVGLGVIFSQVWPLAPKPGFERVMRTFLVVIPAIGLGVGLQLLLQGKDATQGIYMIFALSAWLGSGHFIRKDTYTAKEAPTDR
jgi:hypothetical protein